MSPTDMRVIVPMAVVTGTLQLKGGPADADLVATTVEALEFERGRLSPSRHSPFPLAMTAELAFRAASRGLPVFTGTRTNRSVASLEQGIGGERLDAAWAVDLVLGLCHPFRWVIQYERREAYPSDLPISAANESSRAPDLLRTTDLRRLVRDMSPAKERMNPEEYRSWRRSLEERSDRVEGLSLARTMDVAIPIRHHEKGKAERWLVGADPPPSMMRVLRTSVPQLLELKITTKDLREGYSRSPALQLVEAIDDFWERARWCTWRSTGKETRQLLAVRGLELAIQWAAEWSEPLEATSDVEEIEVCVGLAEEQARLFRKLCASTRRRLVVLTSFLNPRHVDWVAELLASMPKGSELLLLYGHANDEDTSAREETAAHYQELLTKAAPTRVRVLVRPTNVRSHEKIVVNDGAWFMLGSWNLGSTFSYAPYLEGSVVGRSRILSADLLKLLSEEADEPSMDFLRSLEASSPATQGRKGEPIAPRLQALAPLFQSILDEGVHEARDWRKVREQLTALRDVLWTHFRSPRVELVRGEDLRDVLVEQVSSAEHAVTVATDRLNESGLDASLVRELRLDELRVRILWGLEDPKWRIEDKETLEELKAAREVLYRILAARPDNLRSSERPMGNHSKFVVIDESRLLIGSDNLLAHGRERGSESSREVALLIEHPLLARRAIGAALLARPALWFPYDIHERDPPWEIFELVRREVEALATDSGLRDPHSASLIEFAGESKFREFNPDGTIKVDPAGKPISTNPDLAGRWDTVLRALGKGKSQLYFEELSKKAHECGFFQLVWEADRTFSLYPLGGHPPLPLRTSVAGDPEGLGAGVRGFCHTLEVLEVDPFGPVEEREVLGTVRKAYPWFDPAHWNMDDERFLDFLVESGRIARLPKGKCRRVRESERHELRKQKRPGPKEKEPNVICRECRRPFHHPHYRERAAGDKRSLPGSLCLECRARMEAVANTTVLRKEFTVPVIQKDPQAYMESPRTPAEPLAEGQRFGATCSVCGTAVQVPFRPDGVRPVYCSKHMSVREREQQPPASVGPRVLHDSVCTTCGAPCKVPFVPAPGRPVYCRVHRPPRERR